DVLGGKPFGASGAYEKIVGKVFFSIDPAHPRNSAIVDLDKAPRDAAGRVTFSADLYVLAPKDAARGNGVAFFDVLNRGRKNILRDFNRAPAVPHPTAEADFGDGFLMRQGYTLVWVGWQFDIPRRGGLMALDAPPALDQGKPITGRVSTTFTPNTAEPTYALDDMGRYADTTRYPPLDPASPANTLTVRDGFLGAPRTIPRDQWQFGRTKDGAVVPDISALYLEGGYQPGHFYELSYEARGAVVAGLAFAALRDMASAVKHQQGGPIATRYAYAFGPSQDGRFLRQFLYEGFNADEQDRRAFDGVISHIAGSARSSDFNSRFARPNGLGFFVASLFPYLDLDQQDPVTGKMDGILMKLAPANAPKFSTPTHRANTGAVAALPRSSTQRSMASTMRKCRTTSASISSPARSTSPAVICRRKGRASRSRTATNIFGHSVRCSSPWIAGCAAALRRRRVRIRGLRARHSCRPTELIFRRSPECACRQPSRPAIAPISKRHTPRTRCRYWSRRSIATATSFRAFGSQTWQCRSRPIPAGISATLRSVSPANCSRSPAPTSYFP